VTAENAKKNIAIERERGDGSLRSAEVLLREGLYADAVSRAYYAAFHYARALLLTIGEEPITHAGVERLLHRDLVRGGAMAPDVARLLGRLMKNRLDADYTSEVVFTREAAQEEIDAARRFVEAAIAQLAAGGWTGEASP
jgi:uncharacterized protein (UPF0332 family)